MIKDFRKTEIKKNGQFSFFLHFATTTHCDFKFWKIDPPYCIGDKLILFLAVYSWKTGLSGVKFTELSVHK